MKPGLALYIGGMGARGKNFYNDLACRYGFEAAAKEIQDLYLDGKKKEAIAAVPDELADATCLVGSRETDRGSLRGVEGERRDGDDHRRRATADARD